MALITISRDIEVDMTIERNTTPLDDISHFCRKHKMPPKWKRLISLSI